MSSRNRSFGRPRPDLRVVPAREHRHTSAAKTALYWLRDALSLLATATALAWLVIRFAH